MYRRLNLLIFSLALAILAFLPGYDLEHPHHWYPFRIPRPASLCSGVTSSYGTPTQASGPAELTFCFSKVAREADLGISGDTRELAVAFHSLTFIDQAGEPIGDPLLFGTPEVNALQTADDWFANETDPVQGTIQWAGDALFNDTNLATMRVDIPVGTEGMLLSVASLQEATWMDVLVGGVPAANLRVDNYWHSGYVPIGSPTFEVSHVAVASPAWPAGRYFPTFPESDRVFAIRVRAPLNDQDWSWQQDWRILSPGTPMMDQPKEHHETAMALTLTGMQGIINRSGPRVYLKWEDPSRYETSDFWIDQLRDNLTVVDLDLDGLSAFAFLYRRFWPLFDGAVIYDPDVVDTINLATMLAGLQDSLILHTDQQFLPGIHYLAGTPGPHSINRHYGRWTPGDTGKLEIYTWVYENLWNSGPESPARLLDRRFVGVISPGPPSSGVVESSPSNHYPLSLAARDYLVALRLPALWLSPTQPEESTLLSMFLEDANSPIPVSGFYGNDEVPTVSLSSQYGHWNAALTHPNSPLSSGNLTVFSGVAVQPAVYEPEIDIDRLFATLGRRPIAMLFSSDGDSIQYQMDLGYPGGIDFVWEKVQGPRFGWTINPTLSELAPPVWNYYVRSRAELRSEVSLLSGLSGAGYVYPQLMDASQLDAYLARTKDYLAETGLRSVRVDDRMELWNQALATNYYQHLGGISGSDPFGRFLPAAGLLGTIVGLNDSPWGLGFEFAGVPMPAARPAYTLISTNIDETVTKIMKASELQINDPGTILVDLGASYNWHAGEPREAGTSLFFDHLRSDPGNLVVHGPFATLAPGSYTANFRLKVPDNLSSDPFASLYIFRNQNGVGTFFPNSLGSDTMPIRPDQFSLANVYQDIEVQFTLTEFTNNLEFRIDHFRGPAGVTDLYAQRIKVTRQGGLDLPLFAPVLIGLVGPVAPLNELPKKFVRSFERAGGLVLSPDEFLAALNPEFMLEWAATILPSVQLQTARDFMNLNDYMGSLISIREALADLPQQTYDISVGGPLPINIQANSYITHSSYDPGQRLISFRTHGPPDGIVKLTIFIPVDVFSSVSITDIESTILKIELDGQTYDLNPEVSGNYASVQLNDFEQGLHQIKITLIRP